MSICTFPAKALSLDSELEANPLALIHEIDGAEIL